MKRIVLLLLFLSILLYAQDRELLPVSKTEFVYIDQSGKEHDIDLTNKDFILVSVREEDSDVRVYAVDRDGTVWLSGGISSGEEMGFTPSGKWSVLYKKRYYTSKRYPEPDGSDNMDYSLFFTPWGHALHEGNIDYSSHGCIHVDKKDIPLLYHWARVGIPVLITRHRYMRFARSDLKRIYMQTKKYTRKRK